MKKPLRVLELFAGIGAPRKALQRGGYNFTIVDTVEIDPNPVKSYNAIYNDNVQPQDISKWDASKLGLSKGDVDLIWNSSPCQDISLAGKNKGAEEGSGTRSSLIYEVIRISKDLMPKMIVWENVKGLTTKKHKHILDDYIERLKELGYTSYWKVLNAKEHGVPQNRERVFVVSILGEHEPFVFPEKQELKTKLRDILENEVDLKYYLDEDKVRRIASWKSQGRPLKKVRGLDDICPTVTARSLGDDHGQSVYISNQDKTLNIEQYFQEIWLPINNFPDYEISNMGIVKSTKNGEEIILQPSKCSDNRYLKINLYKDGKCYTKMIHRLVAEHFIPNPENKPEVNHKNPVTDNFCDNRHFNLEWVTSKENTQHMSSLGNGNFPGKFGVDHPNSKQVDEYDINGNFIKTWGSIREIERELNIPKSTIAYQCKNKKGDINGRVFRCYEPQIEKIICEERCDEGLRFFKDNVCGTIRTINAGGDKRVIELLEEKNGQLSFDFDSSKNNDNSYIEKKYKEFIDKNGYIPKIFNPYNTKEVNDVSNTITAACGSTTTSSTHLIVDDEVKIREYKNYFSWQDEKGRINTQDHRGFKDATISGTVPAMERGIPNVVLDSENFLNPDNYTIKIRKLIPLECWRLMGFDDIDFYRAKETGVADSQLYKQAGNSVVVNVIECIFDNLLKDYQ